MFITRPSARLLFRLFLLARARNGQRGLASRFFPPSASIAPESERVPLHPCRAPDRDVTLPVAVIEDLLPVASRIPRTFSLEPTVYNDRLLIVQGQRQYINGPRIKWQQRGVVEHNPS